MAKILAVGIATLDIINSVAAYPQEDAEVRALSQELRRGGNATNTLAVLARLGHACHWAGTLAEEPDARHIDEDLARLGIGTEHVHRLPHGKVPTSYITLNRANGSRTIVHHRDLPEFGLADFERIDLAPFDWLHFEGRNIEETAAMIARARTTRPGLPISVEIEKPRAGIEALIEGADPLFFSRDYARTRGFRDAVELLEWMGKKRPDAETTCAWGEAGAWGRDREGKIHHAAAHPPERIVDTLGAGDTFNAGMIDAKLRGLPLAEALEAANHLAGRKCGLHGFNGLTPERM